MQTSEKREFSNWFHIYLWVPDKFTISKYQSVTAFAIKGYYPTLAKWNKPKTMHTATEITKIGWESLSLN